MGKGRQKGKEIKGKVLGGLSTLQDWMKSKVNEAYEDGEVQTKMGRKIRFPHGGQYRAVNCVVQGTATGDLPRLAMYLVFKALKKRGYLEDCRMFASMHDEIVFEMKKDRLDDLIPLVRQAMTGPPSKLWNFKVPLQVDVELGERWDTYADWDKMHHIDAETGKAKAPVPDFLKGYIDMKPGMYYEGEEPGEIVEETPSTTIDTNEVSEPNEEEGEPSSEPEVEEVAVEETQPTRTKEIAPGEDLDEPYPEPIEDEDKNEEYNGELPVYTYQTNWIVNEKTTQQFLLKLKRVTDWFKAAHPGGDHVLRVKDQRGRTVLSPSKERIVVDPGLFYLIADYEGI